MGFPFFSFLAGSVRKFCVMGMGLGWEAIVCFIIVFVPSMTIYDDNVNLMLYLSKRVLYFWFVLLRKVKSNCIFFLQNQNKSRYRGCF